MGYEMMSISSGAKTNDAAAAHATTAKSPDAAVTDSATTSTTMTTGTGMATDMTADQVQQNDMTASAMTGKPADNSAMDGEQAARGDDTVTMGQPAGSRPTNWILEQPADHYTIQLISSLKDDTLPAFIDRNHLSGQVAYFRKRVKGQTRHTLIYGVYPDTAAARAAIEELPDAVRRSKPWVLGIGSVQKAINEFNNTP